MSTPSGGYHLYYRPDASVDGARLRQPDIIRKFVNVRAGNGYVVSPGSQTKIGSEPSVKATGAYTPHNASLGFTVAPPALVEHCSPIARETVAPTPGEYAPDGLPVDPVKRQTAIDKMRRALEPLEKSVPGERNNNLNEAAFALGKIVRDGLLDMWLARQTLIESGEKVGIPRDEEKAASTIRSGLRGGIEVGMPEPKSALAELLALAMPLCKTPTPLPVGRPPPDNPLMPTTWVVERLIYPGNVTWLSGAGGSGKTTLIASLMAASAASVVHYRLGGGTTSDVGMAPACWVLVSYEGGRHIRRTMAAWHEGSGLKAVAAERIKQVTITDQRPLIYSDSKRNVLLNEAHKDLIVAAIDEMAKKFPGTDIVLVIDNATAAVENNLDPIQVGDFARFCNGIAMAGHAVVVLAHPPKSGSSEIYGSHQSFVLADIVAVMETLTRSNGEWVQWVEFSKHREADNEQALVLSSRRIEKPLLILPDNWGYGHTNARDRAQADLRVPFISSICVVSENDKKTYATGVSLTPTRVTPKPDLVLPSA